MTVSQPSETFGAAVPPIAATKFRDPATITRVLQVMLWMSIAVDVVAVGSGLMEALLLQDMQAGTLPRDDMIAAAEASDLRQRIVGFTQIALFVITGIVFARWIYVLNDNKRRLGAGGLRFTPGWAVGWFFVPIATFWKPYQAMKELWQVSADPQQWQDQPAGDLLPWWWFLWLANNIFGQISFRMSLHAETIPQLIFANVITDIADVFSIALGFAALALVSRIAGMQRERGRELATA